MRVTVYGMWHLGCISAACLADAGHEVVGLDPDAGVITGLACGEPPLHEPGLAELTRAGLASGWLRFTTDPADALAGAEVVWVAFDTPVDEHDRADVAFVRRRLEEIAGHIPAGALVLINSQVPAGFTTGLEWDWAGRGLRFAYSPENLRLGKALDAFRKADRFVVGVRDATAREIAERLFAPLGVPVEWMGVESAEMTKHALNAFLAASVTFANELARVCEAVGADAKEVERGLKTDARIGPRAYLSPGAAFAGGTLARDVRFLIDHGARLGVETPLFAGIRAGNEAHKGWLKNQVRRLVGDQPGATVAVLGLTYKPGTSTLRRSSAVELCRWLAEQGLRVAAHDPEAEELPAELRAAVDRRPDPAAALDGADLAVVATEWPLYRTLQPEEIAGRMRRPRVLDPNHFLAAGLAGRAGIEYVATGRAA